MSEGKMRRAVEVGKGMKWERLRWCEDETRWDGVWDEVKDRWKDG